MTWGAVALLMVSAVAVAVARRAPSASGRERQDALTAALSEDSPTTVASRRGVRTFFIAGGLLVAGATSGLGACAIAWHRLTSPEPWDFDARLVTLDEAQVCLDLFVDGPGYLDECQPREQVVNLPAAAVAGACLRLRQHIHGDLAFVRFRDYPERSDD